MKGINFVALDVETANEDHSSICQIGLAKFRDGVVVDTISQLINPNQEFSFDNVDVHGITARDVESSPTMNDFIDAFWHFVGDDHIVTHTAYDRTAMNKASIRYDLPFNEKPNWLDSARVTRRAWSQFSERGYGLGNICKHLGITFKHHDALEDAIACGKVLIAACEARSCNLEDWFIELNKKQLSRFEKLHIDELKGNPEGSLAGNIIVFTGNLTLSRAEAAELASKAGCDVAKGVTKKTTMLVVGDQDMTVLAGHDKSSKHRKVEDLIAKGQAIQIMTESDFMAQVSS
ncbi:exonuclease domain-containing protein [uncultured Pseudoalteromonas sp.]|uniref:exonuclease domain-containing protein n=1 Tax=uncultured Pseudoalteromonas sp. TaxID=114053 RepID=UPI002592CB48|nr:exonuclease domain-containing protein [uncultured Pseudoalteromonas sp.]